MPSLSEPTYQRLESVPRAPRKACFQPNPTSLTGRAPRRCSSPVPRRRRRQDCPQGSLFLLDHYYLYNCQCYQGPCVCVCVCSCTFVHTCVHGLHVCTQLGVCVCSRVHLCIYMYVSVPVHVCVHAQSTEGSWRGEKNQQPLDLWTPSHSKLQLEGSSPLTLPLSKQPFRPQLDVHLLEASLTTPRASVPRAQALLEVISLYHPLPEAAPTWSPSLATRAGDWPGEAGPEHIPSAGAAQDLPSSPARFCPPGGAPPQPVGRKTGQRQEQSWLHSMPHLGPQATGCAQEQGQPRASLPPPPSCPGVKGSTGDRPSEGGPFVFWRHPHLLPPSSAPGLCAARTLSPRKFPRRLGPCPWLSKAGTDAEPAWGRAMAEGRNSSQRAAQAQPPSLWPPRPLS